MIRACAFAIAPTVGMLLIASDAFSEPTVLIPGFQLELVAQDVPARSDIEIAPPGFAPYEGDVFISGGWTDFTPERDYIIRVDADTGEWSIFVDGLTSDPEGLAFGPGGVFGTSLYVNTNGGEGPQGWLGRILKIDPAGTVTRFGSSAPPIDAPHGGGVDIAFSLGGPFGTCLYSGASGGIPGDNIFRIPPSGSPTELFHLFGPPEHTQHAGSPWGLVFGNGIGSFGTNLYAAIYRSPGSTLGIPTGIYVLDPAGIRTLFVPGGAGTQLGDYVMDLEFGPGGAFGHDLYASATGSGGGIMRISDTGVLTQIVLAPLGTIAFDGQSALYFSSVETSAGVHVYRLVPCDEPSISGSVLADGSPLPGITVTASAGAQSGLTDESGYYEIYGVADGSTDVTIVVPAGYQVTSPVGGQATAVVAACETATQDFALTGLGTISGAVLANCPEPGTGLYGVKIDAFEEGTGDLVANAVTGENGYFEMLDVVTGDYVVTIITPLGYDATSDETSIHVVGGETSAADFSLSCVPIVAEPRTIGFWKHQVGVAVGGRGHAQLDGQTLCGLLDDIEAHFNNSPLNPVVVYVPPASGECMDKLEAAKQLLNLRGNVHMSARAKQQLTALLLNVVVGYVDQAGVISGDGRTVSQAITYCDELIDTGADYERAKTIADLVNNNQPVPDGWIPVDTPTYSYSLPLIRQVPKGHFMVAPNPGFLARTFSFGLGSSGWVKLEIYDAAGRLVTTPFSGKLGPGPQLIRWDGQSARGASLGHGQYFARLTTPGGQQTIKLLVLNR